MYSQRQKFTRVFYCSIISEVQIHGCEAVDTGVIMGQISELTGVETNFAKVFTETYIFPMGFYTGYS